MTREEKLLYHQIHPLKLLTDWTAGFAALPLLWRHRLRAALVVTVPIDPLLDPDHQIRASGAIQAVSVRALRRAIHDQRDAGRSSRGLPHHVARRLVPQAVVGASRRAGRTVRMVLRDTLSAPGWVTHSGLRIL